MSLCNTSPGSPPHFSGLFLNRLARVPPVAAGVFLEVTFFLFLPPSMRSTCPSNLPGFNKFRRLFILPPFPPSWKPSPSPLRPVRPTLVAKILPHPFIAFFNRDDKHFLDPVLLPFPSPARVQSVPFEYSRSAPDGPSCLLAPESLRSASRLLVFPLLFRVNQFALRVT